MSTTIYLKYNIYSVKWNIQESYEKFIKMENLNWSKLKILVLVQYFSINENFRKYYIAIHSHLYFCSKISSSCDFIFKVSTICILYVKKFTWSPWFIFFELTSHESFSEYETFLLFCIKNCVRKTLYTWY